MQRRFIIGAAAVIVLAGLWYAFRPERAFIDQTVSEEFPTVAMSEGAAGESPEMAPAATSSVLAAGEFQGVAHESRGTATVHELPNGQRILRFTNFRTSNGPDVRVYLVAADDARDNETVTRAGFIEVAPLKGNEGDQNYELPADVDLSRYRAVTIWCKRFGVNFGTAPLRRSDMTTPATYPTSSAAPTMRFAAEGMVAVEGAIEAEPTVLATGSFRSVAHETSGRATVYRLDDASRVLRLTSFSTSNGPDVRVYLVAAPEARDHDTVKRAGFIELGPLKGNKGDQNYTIPATVDLAKYRTVVIWCRRFSVNFGSASLEEQRS